MAQPALRVRTASPRPQPLSNGVKEIITLVDDPRTSVAKLTSAIAKNQVLMERVLRQANSPVYGFPRRINDPNFAVVLLGFDALKEMIVRSVVTGAFRRMVNSMIHYESFWSHSIGCGLGARMIAEETGICDPDEAFVAGLLHDIGVIILNGSFTGQPDSDTRPAGNETDSQGESTPAYPEHPEAGAWLAEKWNVTASIIDAIRHHHTPSHAAIAPALTAAVHVAEVLCHVMKVGEPGFETVESYDAGALAVLGLTEELLTVQSSRGYVASFLDNVSRAPKFEALVTELKRNLIEAMEDLSEKERLVLALLYYESLTVADVSKVLEVSVADVEQLQGTALARLQAAITLMA